MMLVDDKHREKDTQRQTLIHLPEMSYHLVLTDVSYFFYSNAVCENVKYPFIGQ